MSESAEARSPQNPSLRTETLAESVYRMATAEGASDTEVAQLFGISQDHVWGIRTGRRWQGLTAETAHDGGRED